MSKPKKSVIEVKGATIAVLSGEASDYISLTDIAKFKNSDHADDVIRNWLRNRNTVEFLGVWERLNSPKFNPVEFDGIKTQTGLNSFTLTPKQWIEKTGAIGIMIHLYNSSFRLLPSCDLFGGQLSNLLEELNATLAA